MPEAFDQHWGRGWDFYEAEQFEEAIAEWRAAADLEPEDGYVLNNIGRALSELGQREDAIAEWRQAMRLEPNYDKPLINLVNALSASGYSLEALKATQAAIKISPETAGLYRMLGFHLMHRFRQSGDENEWPAAEAAFQQAITLDASDIYSYRHLAKIKWYLKQKQAAIRTLKAAIKVNPIDAESYIQLWNYQSRARDFRGMIQTVNLIGKLQESDAF